MLTRSEFQKQAARILADYEGHRVDLTAAKASLAHVVDEVLESFVVESPDEALLEEIVRDRAMLILDGYYEEEISGGGAYNEIKAMIQDMIRDPGKAHALIDEFVGDLKPGSDQKDEPKKALPEDWDLKWGDPPDASI